MRDQSKEINDLINEIEMEPSEKTISKLLDICQALNDRIDDVEQANIRANKDTL